MTRNRLPILLILLTLLMLPACKPRSSGQPAIGTEVLNTQSGWAVRVTGSGWRAGVRVTVVIAEKGTSAGQGTAVSTALTDASGAFTTVFLLPSDPRWKTPVEISAIAVTNDQSSTAISTFANPAAFTPTAAPRVTPALTPTSGPSQYVVGYIISITAESRTLSIQPVEGKASAVALAQSATIAYQGVELAMDLLRVRDLIEAAGVVSEGRLVAQTVRVLTRGSLEPTPTPTPTQVLLTWKGEYFPNVSLSGAPVLVRNDPVIDFQWQGSSPAAGISDDAFAVRWTGAWPFEEGNYRFYAQVDDGVRLALDDHWIIDRWHESAGALYTADAYLSRNTHLVKVEYFEARDLAQARVWWEYRGPESKPGYQDWQAEYYPNTSLTGLPYIVLNDRSISFDWKSGPPVAGMQSDEFSARWTRTLILDTGIYVFEVVADDGVRLWVDDGLLIDQWRESAAQTYSAERFLSAGSHRLQVEYYENTGEAVIQVVWKLLPATPTPTATLPPPTPTSTVPLTATPEPTSALDPAPTSERPPANAASAFSAFLPLASQPRRAVRAALAPPLGQASHSRLLAFSISNARTSVCT